MHWIRSPYLLPLACLLLLPAAAQALTEEEILQRFEQYEQRIQVLEQELKVLRERESAPRPEQAAAQGAVDTETRQQVAELADRLNFFGDEVREARERIHVDGFATVGVARSNTSEFFQASGDQVNDDFDFTADSVFGLQGAFRINERTEFVAQVVARGVDETRSSDEFDLSVEWAYLNFELPSNLQLRAGRSRAPLFMHSEYLELGYAYPWVRPPVEVYGLLTGFSSYDGLNLRYSEFMGDGWLLSSQTYWGGRATSTSLSGSSLSVDIDDMFGLTADLRKDALRLFLGYARADVSLGTLPAVIAPLETALNAAGQTLVVDKEDVDMAGAGFQWDDGQYLLMGEYSRVRVDNWLLDWESWYLTTGYRFDRYLAHLTFAHLNSTDRGSRVFLGGAVDLGLAPFFIDAEQESWTLGLRYDLSPGVALKAEWQRISGFNGTAGLFSAPPGESAQVWSLVLDALF